MSPYHFSDKSKQALSLSYTNSVKDYNKNLHEHFMGRGVTLCKLAWENSQGNHCSLLGHDIEHDGIQHNDNWRKDT